MDDNDKLMGQAKQFDEKINTIKSQFFSALGDFKKYYIYFNKNPEVNEFENFYASSKGQLQKMSSDIFLMTNNIDKIIENLNEEMSGVSSKLENAKELNKELRERLHLLQNTQSGSEIMLDDSTAAYNIQYYKNWQMFIGMLIVLGLILKIYKTPVK